MASKSKKYEYARLSPEEKRRLAAKNKPPVETHPFDKQDSYPRGGNNWLFWLALGIASAVIIAAYFLTDGWN